MWLCGFCSLAHLSSCRSGFPHIQRSPLITFSFLSSFFVAIVFYYPQPEGGVSLGLFSLGDGDSSTYWNTDTARAPVLEKTLA